MLAAEPEDLMELVGVYSTKTFAQLDCAGKFGMGVTVLRRFGILFTCAQMEHHKMCRRNWSG